MAETVVAPAGKSDDKVMAAVATMPVVGLVMLLAMKDASPVVKHYARQSNGLLALNLAVFVLSTVLAFIPLLGCIAPIFGLVPLVAWVLLLIKVLNGEAKYMLPMIGEMADKWMNK